MHLQDRSAVVDLESGGVVTNPGSIGGPDLDEPCAARFHHQWEPERSADFNELPSRHRDGPPRGSGGKGEQHRRRVVVDDQTVLGTGECLQEST